MGFHTPEIASTEGGGARAGEWSTSGKIQGLWYGSDAGVSGGDTSWGFGCARHTGVAVRDAGSAVGTGFGVASGARVARTVRRTESARVISESGLSNGPNATEIDPSGMSASPSGIAMSLSRTDVVIERAALRGVVREMLVIECCD